MSLTPRTSLPRQRRHDSPAHAVRNVADTEGDVSEVEELCYDTDEHEEIPDDIAATSRETLYLQDEQRNKVNHALGDHKLRCDDFTKRVMDPEFDGPRALEYLQRRYTLDYGSKSCHKNKKTRLGPASKDDDYYPKFYLDFLVTISFRNWSASYSDKHGADLGFDLEQRTFRFATAGTRDAWFIVMHPRQAVPMPSTTRDRARRSTALSRRHAELLGEYIKQPTFILDHNDDPFWSENQPAFHAYDYGANIEIEATSELWSIPAITRLRAPDESEYESEDESEDESNDSGHNHTNHANDLDHDTNSRSHHSSTPAPNIAQDDQGSTPSPTLRVIDSLCKQLGEKYSPASIESISYAVAVNIHYATEDSGVDQTLCLLADRNRVAREYRGTRDYTFYPMAFHPAYGNFSSPEPPAFLDNKLFAIIQDNISYENDGGDVVSFGFFQAYSNLKRTFRHRADDLLASQGVATAALTVPRSDGDATPHDRQSSIPFTREARRVQAALDQDEFAFRLEQVVTVRLTQLVPERRTFPRVLEPIGQIAQYFLAEREDYLAILRRFPPTVFPTVLVAFARLFYLALEEMRKRFEDGCRQGLGLALSEGTAALDRLGAFCFTGDPRVLPVRVFRPLGTMQSLRQGAWPFIDPAALDLQKPAGSIHIQTWPKRDGRPLLLHFAELGGRNINGLSAASTFLNDLFTDLWIQETRTFIATARHRALRKGARSGRRSPADEPTIALRAWERCDDPFSWRQFVSLDLDSTPPEKIRNITRDDLARDLYNALTNDNKRSAGPFAQKYATWPAILKAALQHTDVNAIALAIRRSDIEWCPGQHGTSITYKHVIRLQGSTRPTPALPYRKGSSKRAAIEAEHRILEGSVRKRARRPTISFNQPIPFTYVPTTVIAGFKIAFRRAETEAIKGHYQLALDTLTSCLGEPIYDLMLMIALTHAASTETP
ncbi:uncharacterized protein F5Z01DRAFT_641250 [Emericellopsis atlantica]|uniref:Uncharacterized protein n=1 Tax=Emericellopsis atlantica TaxID=2614577 RepID=A0A9P7ZCX4_9HYPO|nr:uncharacterized protein F5Z01DRAFT_641250 [Emericellopsis atlantica]KAG9249377.1 hypothetical protein F5Z01DRAFT_641250 [Emericellopsis atlantica]